MKREKDFQAEFGRALVASGCWYYKFPDAMGDRFTLEKPCDCQAVMLDGTVLWIELKVCDDRLYLSELRVSQLYHMKFLRDRHQLCLLAILFRDSNRARVIPFSSAAMLLERGIKTYVPADKGDGCWLWPTKVQQRLGRRGLPIGGKGSWDLKPLWDYIRTKRKERSS